MKHIGTAVTRRMLEVWGAAGIVHQGKAVARWRKAVHAGQLTIVRSKSGSLLQSLEVRP